MPESAHVSEVSGAPLQKNLIFVIDDEEDLVEIIGSMLEKFSFPWKGYTDPSAAVADFEKHDPILVLSDMKMPKLTGLDVLARAKEYNPDLPVIFISSHLDKETLIEAMSLGIYGVIEKPFKELNVISQVNLSLKHTKMWQLLNRSIDMILFQLQDLEQFLISKGKKDVAQILRSDVEGLLMAKRELKSRPPKRP